MHCICRYATVAGIAATSTVAAAHSQAALSTSATGRITGQVFDSLANQPLGGASVFLVGTAIATKTDPAGRYAFDSLPAGSYHVAFESATLDSIGLTPESRSVVLRVGSVDTVDLSVPSIGALLRVMCPQSQAAGGQSILVGSIHDATSGAPVSTATITLSWVELSVENKRVQRLRHVVPARSAADGSYAFCGLPADVSVSLQAVDSNRISGVLEIQIPAKRLVRRDLNIWDYSAAQPRDASTRWPATLVGLITDSHGQPIPGAQIELAGDSAGTRSDEKGKFRLGNLPAGTWDVVAQRVGFLPSRSSVDLHPGTVTTTAIALRTATNILDTVRVVAHAPDPLELAAKARQYPGASFFSREKIDSMHPDHVTDILRQAPGVQLVYPDSGGPPLVQMLRTRFSSLGHDGLCPIEYYVDGVRFEMDNSPDINLQPGDIEAIEVYDGASKIPPQYSSGEASCGVIVIWTRRSAGS